MRQVSKSPVGRRGIPALYFCAMPWPLEQLLKELDVIKQAPISFFIVLVLCVALAYCLMRWMYKDALSRKDELIAVYREKLGLEHRDKADSKASTADSVTPIPGKVGDTSGMISAEDAEKLRGRITELERENAALKQEPPPTPVEIPQPPQSKLDVSLQCPEYHNLHGCMEYWLKVHNPSDTETVNNVRVEITEARIGDEKYYNIPLHDKDETPPYKYNYTLNPGGHILFGFIKRTESDLTARPCHPDYYDRPQPRQGHCGFDLLITGSDTPPLRKRMTSGYMRYGKFGLNSLDA